jgi:hypothetical protein
MCDLLIDLLIGTTVAIRCGRRRESNPIRLFFNGVSVF